MAMRRSPTRPLILGRRKLPFHPNHAPATTGQPGASDSKDAAGSAGSRRFPDGARILDHPSVSDTQVVVIPETTDLQSVIAALTAKGKESGVQGPNRFILLRDTGAACHPAAEGVAAVGQRVTAEPEQSLDVKPVTGGDACMGFIFSKLILQFECLVFLPF